MTTTPRPAIRWFREVGTGYSVTGKKAVWELMLNEAGGKGANLAEMTRAGIPVPPGFVVTSYSYFDFLDEAGLRPVIKDLLSGLDHANALQLDERARQIMRAIEEAPMPARTSAAIKEAYIQMGGGYVAVRSSATAEDLPDASFAGQQSTFLNIVGTDNVVEAVRACWASLFEPRAVFYRAENKYDHLSVGIAVPVQQMVQSDVSGVMFTVDPVMNDTSVIFIEAVYGLGEAIVSGQVDPDEYVVVKDGLKLKSKNVVPQDWQLKRNPEPTHDRELSNIRVDVPAGLSQRAKLTDDQIFEIAGIGKQLEAYYNHPQDVEWAMEHGNFYVVQTRPVTTLNKGVTAARQSIDAPVLVKGAGASPGIGSGPVRVIRGPHEIDLIKPGDVLVAEMTTPDYVPAMKRASAIITDKGGRTCHAAIVSREIGIPCVVGANTATTTLHSGQEVTVDGTTGNVYKGIVAIAQAATAVSKYTKTKTRLYVNLADPEFADGIARRNVEGIGLLRAEFIIARIGEHPRHMLSQGRGHEFTEKLAEGIAKFTKAFHPRPVVYRTSDFKTNEYRNLIGGDRYEEAEENPMIGFRGCSRYIADPETFHLEALAIKQVQEEYDNLYLMIPFVRTPQELVDVKKLLKSEGINQGKLWIMVEVPSTVILLDKFIDAGIDGVSIGSNDLTQLVLGVDRDNSKYAELFDERDPAVLWALERVITTAARRGITVSICGQAPSFYPDLTAKLVQWGITSVSVSPDMIDRTRDIIGDVESELGILPTQG